MTQNLKSLTPIAKMPISQQKSPKTTKILYKIIKIILKTENRAFDGLDADRSLQFPGAECQPRDFVIRDLKTRDFFQF